MNKFRFTLNILAIAAFVLAFASFTQAQATRTWVSGVGDDVNPCSRTAPCKTFAGAISKTADGGEIDALDPAGYGTVTITKSITLDGNGTLASILAAGTNGINVNDSGSGSPNTKVVRLRNLSINGAGTGLVGVNFSSGKAVYIESCVIFGFKAGAGHGVSVSLTSGSGQLLSIKDSIINDNLNDGVRLAETGGNAINTFFDNSRFERNGTNGIELAGISIANIRNCSFVNNTSAGVRVADGSSTANIENSFLTDSPGSGVAAPTGNARVRGNHITDNAIGVNCSGGGIISSYGDNAIFGNGTNINVCTDPLPPIQKK